MSGMPDGQTVRRSDGQGVRRAPGDALLEVNSRPSARRPVGPPEPVIIAESPAMRRAMEVARRVAPLGIPVVLVGETGTGKEVFAQAIHRWSGRLGQLVDINCGALTDSMVESLLFGHRRGAFTGATESVSGLVETAHGGTLFLDELGSMPEAGQVKLLRVLESGEVRRLGDSQKRSVDFRLISTLQSERGIRTDLYYRICGAIIHLPPLRERREDLLPLAGHFAWEVNMSLGPGVARALEGSRWLGNVRELRTLIRHAATFADDSQIGQSQVARVLEMSTLPRQGQREESRLIDTCVRYRGNRSEIARALGISIATLYRRLKSVGVELRSFSNSQDSQGACEIVRR